MAEVAVSFVVERVAGVLNGLSGEDAASLRGVTEHIKLLLTELTRIQCFLKQAEKRSAAGEEGARTWIREVRDTAYEVEDVADRMAFISWRKKEGLRGLLRRYASKPFRLKAHYSIGNKLKILKRKMEDLERIRNGLNFDTGRELSHEEIVGGHASNMSPNLPRDALVGFGSIVRDTTSKLQGEPTSRLVMTILGMGGVGKTTLTREIYESVDHGSFPLRAWLTLSKNHTPLVDELLMEIAEQVAPLERYKLQNMKGDELRAHVKVSLMDKPYLIVMDNVWEVDVWDQIKPYLPDCKNGSRVIITTRIENVARHAIPCFPPHELQGLTHEESWELFVRKAFASVEEVQEACVGELRSLAERLVRSCRGLPLALVMLGGFLSGKSKTWASWNGAVGGVDWQWKNAESICLEILRLSYEDMPCHLKWCFLYLGAFRKDREVEAERLVKLCVAEGFACGSGSEEEEEEEHKMEDLARVCLGELNRRGMLEFKEKRERQMRQLGSLTMFMDATKTFCRMHDIVRNLCDREAEEANFVTIVAGSTTGKGARRCSLVEEAALHADASSALRTLLAFRVQRCFVDFADLKLLRVVDLEQSKIEEIPEEIGYMYHLKYLGLGGTYCKSVPSSLCEVSTLETLDLRGTFVRDLPNGFWKITKLRHVHCECEPHINSESAIPVELQTLELARTGSWVEVALSRLTNLRFLDMSGDLSRCTGLRLPVNLAVLNLYEARMGEDIWAQLQGELKLLRVLYLGLDAYPFDEMVCETGGFPRLEELSLFKLGALESWTIEEGAMPNLSRLSITWCHKLRMLPEGLQHLGNVREFICKDMPSGFFDRLRVGEGADWSKILHVPHLQIDMTSSEITAFLALVSPYAAKAKVILEVLEIEEVLERLEVEERAVVIRVHDTYRWLVEEMDKLVECLQDKDDPHERSADAEEEINLLNDVRDVASGIFHLGERFCSFVFRMRRRSISESIHRHAFKASYFKELHRIAEDAQALVRKI